MADIKTVAISLFAATPDILILQTDVEVPVFQIAGLRFEAPVYDTEELAQQSVVDKYLVHHNAGDRGILMVYKYAPTRVVSHFYKA